MTKCNDGACDKNCPHWDNDNGCHAECDVECQCGCDSGCSGWISVKERLPIEDAEVLFVVPKRRLDQRHIGWWDGEFWYTWYLGGRGVEGVTHWMPLLVTPAEVCVCQGDKCLHYFDSRCVHPICLRFGRSIKKGEECREGECEFEERPVEVRECGNCAHWRTSYTYGECQSEGRKRFVLFAMGCDKQECSKEHSCGWWEKNNNNNNIHR